MYIRPKTKRRLLILLGLGLLMVGVFIVLCVVNSREQDKSNRPLREEAMAAYRSGDYEKAFTLLQNYRKKTGNQDFDLFRWTASWFVKSSMRDPDPEVEFAFGDSCASIPSRERQYDGILTFEHYLQALKPGDVPAQHELLRLYVHNGRNVEAIHLADAILATNPKDGEALYQKAVALFHQHQDKPKLALAVSQKLNEVEPLNLRGQITTLDLMASAKASDAELIAHAEEKRKAHDQDPRFELLQGLAYAYARQNEPATKWLRSAAERTPPDAEFVARLSRQLDIAGLYPEAAAFLVRAANALPDPAVQYLLAQRMWQDGKSGELLDRLNQRDAKTPAAEASLLSSYRALALFEANKGAEARALVDALSHQSDARSAAWALGLSAEYADPPLKLTDAVARLKQAVTRDPPNPTLRAMLASAYMDTGETELAIQQSAQSEQLAPGWAAPFMIEARAMLATHRIPDAVVKAREAFRRAPDSHDARVLLAMACFESVKNSRAANDFADVLAQFEYIQKTWHDTSILPNYVTALSRSGKRDQAVAAVQAALTVDPPLSTEALTKLAEVADVEKLGIGQDVRNFAQKARGLTPDIAYAQAHALLQNGKGADGLKLLMDASKGHERELSWRILLAGYRESYNPGEALKDWIALGNEFPADLRVQQTILRAPSRMNDRIFWATTIERLKALTGEQGLPWRIERGQWLLKGDLNEKDKVEAINLLAGVTRDAPQLAEAHVLLAEAMQKSNMARGAIDQLRAAALAQPGDPHITRELVRLLLADKRSADASGFLEKLAQNPRLGSEDLAWLASMFVALDARDKAIEVLEKSPDAGIERDLMLARLYVHNDQADKAAPLYQGLLGEPIVDPAFWIEAADFFAARNDLASADKFMYKLAALHLKPGEVEILQARFAEEWKDEARALAQYQEAVKTAPTSAAAWQALAEFQLRHEHFAAAGAAADEGLKATPQNAPLVAIRSHAAILASLGNTRDFEPLVEALWRNPEDAGATEMLAAVAAFRAAPIGDLAQKVAEIARRHPENLYLQSQAVQSLVHAGRSDAALAIAHAAATAHPKLARPQQLLATLYIHRGDWAKAEEAARLWRHYSIERPMQADLALAVICLGQHKDPADAVRTLKPYVSGSGAARTPKDVLVLYARASILARNPEDAEEVLKPKLEESANWRAIWLELAPLQKDAAAASIWIKKAADRIPKDAPQESFALANAWYTVGERFNSPEALENAAQVLEPLLTDSNAPAWQVAGQIATARSDFPAAERDYRQMMTIDPQSPDAKNNLAYVLWLERKDQNLAEARRLVESAINTRPQDAKFYDTLARILAQLGDRPGAIQNFRNAISRDPSSLEAMIGLADLLSRDRSTRQEANELIAKIPLDLPLPAAVAKQFEAVRDTLAKAP